jgi:hypothetical protein
MRNERELSRVLRYVDQGSDVTRFLLAAPCTHTLDASGLASTTPAPSSGFDERRLHHF